MSSPFDTIVIAGGALKTIYYLGSLTYFFKKQMLNEVKNYVGTSAGAIICFLLSIGYSPFEIFKKLLINENLAVFSNFQISINPLIDLIEKMMLDKNIDKNTTLLDHFLSTRKKLFITTFNVTTKKEETLTFKNYPNLLITTALRMSTAIPCLIQPIFFEYNFFIDAVAINNYPISIGRKVSKTSILGLNNHKSKFFPNECQIYITPNILKNIKFYEHFFASKMKKIDLFVSGNFFTKKVCKSKQKRRKTI